jgi:hypothetical protein
MCHGTHLLQRDVHTLLINPAYLHVQLRSAVCFNLTGSAGYYCRLVELPVWELGARQAIRIFYALHVIPS